jgi:hypothetical protein
MTVIIIDTPVDVTPKLPALKAAGVCSVFGYLSSINPHGEKCVTPARARAIAKAGLRLGLVHEGWGGAAGHGGISKEDGERDGAFCHRIAATLGAPKGACVYFACDTDFNDQKIAELVLPYFQAVKAAFADGFYRVGVYGSGAVCRAVTGAGLASLSWEAQSRGWTGYSAWLASASMVQGRQTRLDGLDADTDTAAGDIGDFVPFVEEPNPAPIAKRPVRGTIFGVAAVLLAALIGSFAHAPAPHQAQPTPPPAPIAASPPSPSPAANHPSAPAKVVPRPPHRRVVNRPKKKAAPAPCATLDCLIRRAAGDH